MHAFDALARAEVVGNWFYPFESATLMEQEAWLRRSTNETDHSEPSRLAVLDLCQTVAAVDNTDLKSASFTGRTRTYASAHLLSPTCLSDR